MAENIKTLRHYSAPCHVCGGSGVVPNEFFEFCGGDEIVYPCRKCEWFDLCSRGETRECSVCNGNGTVHLYCVEEPTLELLEVPVLVENRNDMR